MGFNSAFKGLSEGALAEETENVERMLMLRKLPIQNRGALLQVSELIAIPTTAWPIHIKSYEPAFGHIQTDVQCYAQPLLR